MALIAVTCLALYSNTLKNEFVYDDVAVIVQNNLVKNIARIPTYFTKPVISTAYGFEKGYRPLVMASFNMNYALGGLNVIGYHAVNIFFHTANALLAYILIITILGITKSNNKYLVALFASLLFAAHPMNTEAVNYVWQRSELMAGFFYLLAVILFLKRILLKKPGLFLLSMISFILALLSKEIAVTIPLIMIILDWYLLSDFKKEKFFGNIRRYHLWSLAILVIYTLFRLFNQGVVDELVSSSKVTPYSYLLTQFSAVVKYLKLLILPCGLSVNHELLAAESFLNINVLLSLGILTAIILISVVLRKKLRLVSLFMAWFFIILIPTSSILPLKILMNEHRVYLSGIGLFVILAISALKNVNKKRQVNILTMVFIMIITVLALTSYNRNADWKNGVTLWSDALRVNPDSVVSLNNRGKSYYLLGFYDKAIDDFSRVIELKPDYALTYNNRGAAYLSKGLTDRAIADFSMSIKGNPGDIGSYVNLAIIYQNKGMYAEALSVINKARDIDDKVPALYNVLGITYARMGKYEEAVKEFSKGLSLNPGDTEIKRNLTKIQQLLAE